MIRRLEHPDDRRFWEIELDDVVLTVRSGPVGAPPDETTDVDDDALPPDVLFERLACEKRAAGFVDMFVDDLIAHIEQGHESTLQGRVRRFFASNEYQAHQGKAYPRLDCVVDFTSLAVQGNFFEQYRDRQGCVLSLMPLASVIVDGHEDEQAWLGYDPSRADSQIYELHTSGEFEEIHPTLDAFLAELR